ncbi:MAG: hypothetical protein JW902_03025 [Syntrophaceae bacterium]|nr:hypothetical protein [Syntrophaceae bacterium]
MKKVMMALGICCLALIFAGMVCAAEHGPVETVVKGCDQEINSYCKDVTPGEGRLIDCLDKNMAKVSARCKQAIQDVRLK